MDIRVLESIEEMREVETLQRRVWPGSELEIVPAHLLITVSHNGGVVLGARQDGGLAGFVFGFLGTDSTTPDRVAMARLKHCSHMLGVDPEYANQGIGYRLKLAQRDLVLQQGIRLITWTFDPLRSKNAHLNVRRLGGVSRTYVRDAYGTLQDELNAGVGSDRLVVDWWITSPRVASRIRGERPPLDLAHFLAAGAQKINPSTLGDDDLVRPAAEPLKPEGNLILIEIPPDFGQILARDLSLARDWRQHARRVFERAFDAGYLITDFVYLKGEQVPRSYYVLAHSEGTLG